MGPLGNGFPVAEVTSTDKILIIGGGIGVPPLYELAKQLENRLSNDHITWICF